MNFGRDKILGGFRTDRNFQVLLKPENDILVLNDGLAIFFLKQYSRLKQSITSGQARPKHVLASLLSMLDMDIFSWLCT